MRDDLLCYCCDFCLIVTARTFLQACQMFFIMHPQDFPDETKIRWMLMLLQKKALTWAAPLQLEIITGGANPPTHITNWNNFKYKFKIVFYDPDEQWTAAHKLEHLQQTRLALEYTVEFRNLVTIIGWTTDTQLKHAFYSSLKDHVKDELARSPDPATLNDMALLMISIDNRISQHKQEKKHTMSSSHKPTTPKMTMSRLNGNHNDSRDDGSVNV